MKKISTTFLQVALVLIAIVALVILIRFPQLEGRAKDLDLFSIYADPFIIYGYLISVAFFIALYKAFRLLGYVGNNKVFTADAVGALKSIKFCAIAAGIMIALAGIYIKFNHHPDDDPAGFLAMCMIAIFMSGVFATAAGIFEKILQNAIDLKSDNDLTI